MEEGSLQQELKRLADLEASQSSALKNTLGNFRNNKPSPPKITSGSKSIIPDNYFVRKALSLALSTIVFKMVFKSSKSLFLKAAVAGLTEIALQEFVYKKRNSLFNNEKSVARR